VPKYSDLHFLPEDIFNGKFIGVFLNSVCSVVTEGAIVTAVAITLYFAGLGPLV
jgi:hypothetical protein